MDYRFKKQLKNLKRERVGIHPNPQKSIFLNRNERVLPCSSSTIELLYQRLAKVQLNLYPDLELFYEKLSRWLGIPQEQIFVTEGVSGAIKSIIETIVEPGDNIVFPTPTFALYPIYCKMFNVEYRTVGYTNEYKLDVKKMVKLINRKTAIVFLPNPNVPIEGTLSVEVVSSIAKHCLKNRAFLAIDEVYYPFGGPTCIDLIKDFNNIFIMRSFSKGFGLAGIRLGYIIGIDKNIEYISKTRTGYETNVVSAEIASFFMDNYYIIEDYIRSVREGLEYLKRELDKLGLEYNGGNASNFIYINIADRGLTKKVVNELRDRDIYIRGDWPPPYDSGVCVTAAPKEIMQKFVSEFSKILNRK